MVLRTARHLITTAWRVRRAFPARSLAAIEEAIRISESEHAGQIRFAVETSLHPLDLLRGMTARERAVEVFSQLRVWDTEQNNGVLIYLLLADHDVEIVADRGIDRKVLEGWEGICREMEASFRKGAFEEGVLQGIRRVTERLAEHFPKAAGGGNELPDRPVLL